MRHLKICKGGKKPIRPRNILPSEALKTNCEPTHIAEAKAPVKEATHFKTKKATCDICSKVLSRSNLRRHIKEVHRTTPAYKDLQITYVSPSEGLFMVSRNLHAPGNQHPIHVKYSVSASQPEVYCESPDCVGAAQAFSLGQNRGHSCQHVAAIAQQNVQLPQQKTLRQHDLEDLCKLGVLSPKFKEKVTTILDMCQNKGIAPVINATLSPSSSFLYMSVSCEKVKYYSKLGRVVVTFCMSSGRFHCPCLAENHPCYHKQLAKAHLYINRPDLLIQNTDLSDNNDDHMNVGCNNQSNQTTSQQHLAYIKQRKSIPVDISSFKCDILPVEICPREVTCPLCDGHPLLSPKEELPTKATIYDVTSVHHGESYCLFPGCMRWILWFLHMYAAGIFAAVKIHPP